MNDPIASIKTVIATRLRVGADYLQPELTLDELGLDSLTSAEVVLGVEKLFGVQIDFEASIAEFTHETLLVDFVNAIAALVEHARCRG